MPYSRRRNDLSRPSYVIRLLKYQSQRFALCTGYRGGYGGARTACPRSAQASSASSFRPDEVIKDAAAISGASRANELERRTDRPTARSLAFSPSLSFARVGMRIFFERLNRSPFCKKRKAKKTGEKRKKRRKRKKSCPLEDRGVDCWPAVSYRIEFEKSAYRYSSATLRSPLSLFFDQWRVSRENRPAQHSFPPAPRATSTTSRFTSPHVSSSHLAKAASRS